MLDVVNSYSCIYGFLVGKQEINPCSDKWIVQSSDLSTGITTDTWSNLLGLLVKCLEH